MWKADGKYRLKERIKKWNKPLFFRLRMEVKGKNNSPIGLFFKIKPSTDIHNFFRYFISGNVLLLFLFLLGLLTKDTTLNKIVLCIISQGISSSLIILLFGFPLGFLLDSIFEFFYWFLFWEEFYFYKYINKLYQQIKSKINHKCKLSVEECRAINDMVLFKDENEYVKNRIIFLSSRLHLIGSSIVSFSLSLIFWVVTYFKLSNMGSFKFWTIFLIIIILIILSCINWYRNFDLMNQIGMLFLKEEDENVKKYLGLLDTKKRKQLKT